MAIYKLNQEYLLFYLVRHLTRTSLGSPPPFTNKVVGMIGDRVLIQVFRPQGPKHSCLCERSHRLHVFHMHLTFTPSFPLPSPFPPPPKPLHLSPPWEHITTTELLVQIARFILLFSSLGLFKLKIY